MDDKYSASLVSEHTRWAINRGQHIAYRVDAPAETAASAETVVLQHGYTSSKEDWAGYSAALVAAGYRCISIDSLGHGESASPSKKENYGRLPRAEDIIAVMDAEVRNRFVRSLVPSTILPPGRPSVSVHLFVHLFGQSFGRSSFRFWTHFGFWNILVRSRAWTRRIYAAIAWAAG